MASIASEKGGRRRILFVAPDGSRKTIRLGKVSQRIAEAVKVKVERLVSAVMAGHAPDDETLALACGARRGDAAEVGRRGPDSAANH